MSGPEPTPGLREALREAIDYARLSPTGERRKRWEAALAASPAPEPTPGLREAFLERMRAPTRGERGDRLTYYGLSEEAALDIAEQYAAALAASPAPEPTHGVAIWGDYGVTCSCTVVLDWPGGWSRNEVAAGRLVARHAAPEPTGLDAAWAEAEAALPEGWAIQMVWGTITEERWGASAGPWPSKHGDRNAFGGGETPAAALRALAARLGEREA